MLIEMMERIERIDKILILMEIDLIALPKMKP